MVSDGPKDDFCFLPFNAKWKIVDMFEKNSFLQTANDLSKQNSVHWELLQVVFDMQEGWYFPSIRPSFIFRPYTGSVYLISPFKGSYICTIGFSQVFFI